LRQVPLFEQFGGRELGALAGKFEKVEFTPGVKIINQGEWGNLFYIIELGKVSVSIDGQERALLGTGEYFGEIALLTDIPRTATVTTLEPTVLLQLSAPDFSELIQASNASKQALERVSSRRRLSNERWLSGSSAVSL
jgi:CRP-like cAMP-binding protein